MYRDGAVACSGSRKTIRCTGSSTSGAPNDFSPGLGIVIRAHQAIEFAAASGTNELERL